MFTPVGPHRASGPRPDHWTTLHDQNSYSFYPFVGQFYSPAESDDDSVGGGLMPDQTPYTNEHLPFPPLTQTSAGSTTSDRPQFAPDDLWVTSTHNEYADDTPYIPPALHSDNYSSNTRPLDEYRPPLASQSVSHVEPQLYDQYQHSDSPGTSESGGSLSSHQSRFSGSHSSGESEVQTSRHTYESSSPYFPPQASSQRPHNPDLYPAYNERNQRIGLEHTRGDAREHVSTGQSYYRPQTHTYGTRVSPPQAGRHAHQVTQQSPSPPPAHVQPPRVAQPDPAPPSYQAPSGRQPRVPHSFQVPVEDIPDPEPMMRQMLGMGMGASQEISLAILDDPPPGEKPNYPYPTLTKLAIYGSERKKLTLQEIYAALEDRFEWFKQRSTSDTAWKRSIRHLLSLNKTFRKVPRPVTDPGKGSYWIVDYSQGEGNKRVRKRNKKPTKAQLARQAAEERARQGQPPAQSGSAPGPSNTRSDSEDSHKSGQGVFGGFDDATIDPTLTAQGHRVGMERPAPRTRVRANPPYENTLSSSDSSGSPEPQGHHTSPTSFGHYMSNMNPTGTLAPNQPAFGRSSLGATFPVASAIPPPLAFGTPGHSSGSVPPATLGSTVPTESGPSGRGFSEYQNNPTSFLQGRTLPVPTPGGRAAASARSSNVRTQNPSNLTLAPIRPAPQQRNESGSSEGDERGFSMAPFSSPN